MNNSLGMQELCVCQRQGDTCGSVFSGEGTEPAKTQRQGHSKETCRSGASERKQDRGGAGLQVIYLTTEAPAPSDRTALEGVVKRGFVDLV